MGNTRRRSAFTLIEVITVMVVFSLLMGVAIPFLARLQRGVQVSRNAVAETRTCERLARQFRADARQSRWLPAAAPVDGRLALLQSPELAIAWRFVPGGILREASRDGAVVQREVYRLSDLTAADVAYDPANLLPLRLTLVRRASGVLGKSVLDKSLESSGAPYSIEARLAAR